MVKNKNGENSPISFCDPMQPARFFRNILMTKLKVTCKLQAPYLLFNFRKFFSPHCTLINRNENRKQKIIINEYLFNIKRLSSRSFHDGRKCWSCQIRHQLLPKNKILLQMSRLAIKSKCISVCAFNLTFIVHARTRMFNNNLFDRFFAIFFHSDPKMEE